VRNRGEEPDKRQKEKTEGVMYRLRYIETEGEMYRGRERREEGRYC
jgi:hypothetical protein